MNQTELSGFISSIVVALLSNTGSLSGVFYPLKTNPSGYLQSGAFISQLDLDSAVAQTLSYVAENYYLQSNPSGFITGGGGGGLGDAQAFSVNCMSGVDSQQIAFPVAFTGIPQINCSFLNNVDSNIYYLGISGVSTTGFAINYSATISNSGYKLSILAEL